MIDRKLLTNLIFTRTNYSHSHSQHFYFHQNSIRLSKCHHSTLHSNQHSNQTIKPKLNYQTLSALILFMSTGILYINSTHHQTNRPIKPNQYEKFKIQFIRPLNEQTNLFSIEIKTSNQINLPNHLFYLQSVYIKHPELQIERAYTNLNTICSNQSTWIEFLVKSYSDGEVSNYLKRFKSTDPNRLIEIRGPELNWCHPNDNLNEIVFIVGGTGITPVIQLLRRFYGPEQSHENLTHSIPKMKIIYLSKSKDAIYLNEELLKYSNLDSNLEIHKVITQPSCDNQSNVLVDKIGKLEINDLKKWIGMGSDQINRQRIILVCGPDSMVKAIAGSKGSDMVSQGELGGMLKELGYHQEEVYKL